MSACIRLPSRLPHLPQAGTPLSPFPALFSGLIIESVPGPVNLSFEAVATKVNRVSGEIGNIPILTRHRLAWKRSLTIHTRGSSLIHTCIHTHTSRHRSSHASLSASPFAHAISENTAPITTSSVCAATLATST